MTLQVESISKSYGEQLVLNQITFHAKKGEIIGILGPNGAGKSTLMKILTGFLAPDAGEARVLAINVKENALQVKNNIGYLPEQNPLYKEMYLREYLGFHAAIHVLPQSDISSVIEAVGLGTEAHKKIGQLSKGYQQRVGLAAAIMHDPEVLILDEPSTGLDPNQLVEIRNLIKELGKDKTILLSSHIMQEVEAICDRVIIIHKGEILKDALLEELDEDLESIFQRLTKN